MRIPIFIPGLGCKFKCIYCNQKEITSCNLLNPSEIQNTIEEHLKTASFSKKTEVREIAFFGGTFSALPLDLQKTYLEIALEYIKSKDIDSIRFSTRPDDINLSLLEMYKNYRVSAIELGAQSLDNEVLEVCKRGHSVQDVEEASRLIIENGFCLGLQMMIGLPKDSLEKSLATAKKIVELGAKETRIYPCLVIKDTELASMYQNEDYAPLSMEEALEYCASLIPIFETAGVEILRIGLHPSENLIDHSGYLAGPFHPSFRSLAESRVWNRVLKAEFGVAGYTETTGCAGTEPCGSIPEPEASLGSDNNKQKEPTEKKLLRLYVNPKQVNFAYGHSGENIAFLKSLFAKAKIYPDQSLKLKEFRYTVEGF